MKGEWNIFYIHHPNSATVGDENYENIKSLILKNKYNNIKAT